MMHWPACRFERRQRPAKRSLRFELLRQRAMLDGAGLGVSDALPWFDPGALTYSFAPDSTMVAGQESSLFEEMSALGT
ncbi:MAG: hypothetical protein KDB00_19860, partial [Planctomycetales bacterium]|nr:hypothetical protein [Planctomycetales bacterium]